MERTDQHLNRENTLQEGSQIGKKSGLRENIEAILIAVILALFIRTFFVQAFKIPSGSMKQTLQIGDHILVNKFIYGIRLPFSRIVLVPVTDPARGDIVVFKFPEDPSKDFIKRVVAVGGDTVEIRDKAVWVNDKPAPHANAVHLDPRIYPRGYQPRDNFGPVQVPENTLFVMGDNRDESYDSRFWGFVDLEDIKGKAFMIYWSWDSEKTGIRWGRIGNLLR